MMPIRDVRALSDALGVPFSDEQLAPITAAADGVHAIIAGAGSGKTTVMAARVVWLVAHEAVPPDRVLGLTFTNKAAAELRTRIRSSLRAAGIETDGADPTVATYHAFAGQLISEHGMRLGIEPDVRILTDARRHQLVIRMLRRRTAALTHVSTDMRTLVNDILALDGELNEHDVSTDQLRAHDRDTISELAAVPKQLKLHTTTIDTCRKRIELSGLVDDYRDLKREEGVMDFADQMAGGKRLSHLREVRDALRDRFDVVLLDEYQDTSVAQRDLLVNLFGPARSDERPVGVSAVGDPAQGIYGWRGAATGNLENFLDDFQAAERRPFALTTTRRCASAIIGAANHIARDFYGEQRQHLRLQAPPGADVGSVSVALHETIVDEIAALVDRVRDIGPPWNEIGVLVRVAKENHELVAAFRAAGIPVEIVGLKGLLNQPEVVDLMSALEVVDDMTANPALLRLLTGPRWRIGDRDLALLGQRAQELAGRDEPTPHDLEAVLDAATANIDPSDVLSLAEALEEPGALPFSAEARRRFAELAGILRTLRRHRHEPLVDLARRALHILELDVELEVAGLTHDNLRLLFEAIAGYAQSDPFASLTGLLSYLHAESRFEQGLDVAVPSAADSVKLLTVHKAKGLEYTHVLVPFVSGGVFPNDMGRSRWISNAKVIPTALRGDAASLADIENFTTAGVNEYKAATTRESLMEEIRLGYVALTRAKQSVHLSGHQWDRSITKPREVSQFLSDLREWPGVTTATWAVLDEDAVAIGNPLVAEGVPWPVVLNGLDPRRRFAELVRACEPTPIDQPDPLIAPLLDDLDILLAQRAELSTVAVDLPDALSATAAMALAADERAFAESLARPMPRRPVRAARGGTAFHAWVESRYGQQPLLDPSELPGSGESTVLDEEFDDHDLDELKMAFESGPFADRTPHAIEAPFSVRLGGQQLIGRIDAVFLDDLESGPTFHIVDWKTNRSATADPLQLAIYRLAWAEQHGLEPETVRASFYYVRLGKVVEVDDLPDRAGLERLLGLA